MSRDNITRVVLVAVLVLGVGAAWAAGPRVTAVTPVPNSTVAGQPALATANLNQAFNPGDLSPYNFTVIGSGGDDSFTEGNETVPVGIGLPYQTGASSIAIDLGGATMPDDLYAVVLGSAGSPSGGYALQFDGQNDYVEMPKLGGGSNPGPTAVDHLTMEAWVYFGRVDVAQVVLSHGDDYTLGLQNGHLWARIEAGCGNWVQVEGDSALAAGTWYHVAATYDRSALRVYVNGVLDGATAHALAISYCVIEWPVYLGRQDSYDLPGGRFLQGMLDEARLWNVARSPAQLGANMFRRLTGAEVGLIGLWDCDEGTGQTLGDKSGTGDIGRLGSSTGSDSADPVWVASTAPTGALTNAAGEPLDGEFAGTFPSGNGTPGGTFLSTFRIDTTPPRLTLVTWLDYTHVDLRFSENLNQAGAQTAGNYTIVPALAVNGATLDPDGVTVHLTTAQQAESTLHTVTVANVTDAVGVPIQPGNGDAGQWSTPGIPPQVVSATMVDWTHVDVLFNEPVQQASAETGANYTIGGGLTVASATLDPDGVTVHLQTTQMAQDTTYTVTARSVRDLAGNLIVVGQSDSAQWTTGLMATLNWVGAGDFLNKGVHPQQAVSRQPFTWKVKYWGGVAVYVRVRVYRYDIELAGSPFAMIAESGVPATGQVFSFTKQLGDGQYSYRFEAADALSVADGPPTALQSGPIVGNHAPRLTWAGSAGYESDAVEPQGPQVPGTNITFKVRYSDRDGDAAAFVNCHVALMVSDKALVEEEVHGSPFEMTATGDDWRGGVVFELTRQFLEQGRYAVWFSAREDVPVHYPPLDAVGKPTWWHQRKFRIEDLPPRLGWVPGPGLGDDDPPDGLNPNRAAAGSVFSFRATYQDPEGAAPEYMRLHIYRSRAGVLTEIAGSPFSMSGYATDYSQPVAYAIQVFLHDAGRYRYCFAASDGGQEAVGQPTRLQWGPRVTETGAAAVVSLACLPAGAGAQVSFTLSADATVTAEVLNIAGRSVRVIALDRELEEGLQSLAWDGRNGLGAMAPSGLYLVRVTARTEAGASSQAIGTLNLRR